MIVVTALGIAFLNRDHRQASREVSEALMDNLAQNGLMLETVSLPRIGQTPFHALDENNAFNAPGMRRVADIIAMNRKERAAIEADAEVAGASKRCGRDQAQLTIRREEEETMIVQ